MRRVEIEWLDSKGISSEWEFTKDIKPMPPCICHSIGYVHEETEEYITIAQSCDNENNKDYTQIMGRMTIPKCSIRTITELKEDYI